MPKKTVLDVVQNTLSKMDADEVNSISDTVEALQVARVVRDYFYDIVEEMDISFKGELIHLESATDVDHPTRMKIPDNISKVHWINYKKNTAPIATAEAGEDVPPVLSVEEDESNQAELTWTAAEFASGSAVARYDIYRISGPSVVGSEWEDLTLHDDVAGNILTLVDVGTDILSVHYAYGVIAVSEDDEELQSEVVFTQQPS